MNQIYSRIKKSSAGLFIGGGLFMLILGAAIMFFTCSAFFKYFFADAPDLFETPASSYEDGNWYTCDNNILFDYCCSDNDGRMYITSTNDMEYFGFYVYNKDTDKADKISDDTYDFFDGKRTELSTEYLSGKGYLQKMDDAEKRYFEQFFDYGDTNSEDYNLIYYYFIPMTPWRTLTDNKVGGDPFYAIIGLVLFIAGIACICNFIFGGYKRSFKKSMKDYGILPEVLERDMNHSVNIANAYIGAEHAVFVQASGSKVIPYNALIWAYVMITTTKHTTYGIPSGTSKSYQLIMWDRNRKKIMTSVKDEGIGHQILDEIFRRAPYIFSGYSEDLANATDHGGFDQMIQAVDERRSHTVNQF